MVNPLDVLPDFQNFSYAVANAPAGTHIDAWVKLREAERRLAMYKWVEEYNDPGNPQHRVLLNDSVSAFLLTFEAIIQFLKDQFRRAGTSQKFDAWFAQQSQNDVCVKGLRTLRHFEAHVEEKPIPRTVHVHGSEIMGCTWQLPELTQTGLDKLLYPPLSAADLSDWNTLVGSLEAKAIFAEGLYKLRSVLETAEKVI